MNVINKIFNKNIDEEVHSDFLKFGRGEYKDKYLIEGKKQKEAWSIKTGPEFVNLLVKKCLEKAEGNIAVKGIIVSTLDLKEEINFDIKKTSNFQGIKKIEIDTTLDPKNILNLMNKYPRVFFALSFKTGNCELKVKAKAPKSGKPGSKGGDEGPKADFCTLKTSNTEIIDDLFFDNKQFKEIKIKHILKITGIDYPKDVASLKPEEVREKSRRKGVVVREIDADGKKIISEAEFFA
jgi:hypothetical protein